MRRILSWDHQTGTCGIPLPISWIEQLLRIGNVHPPMVGHCSSAY
ncbi:hypothetical protein [Chitinophaga pinensis]